MTQQRPPDEPQPGAPGVFGNLPSARPSVRSPRREGGKARDAEAAEATPETPAPEPAAAAPTSPARPAPQRPAPRPPPPPVSPPPPDSPPTEEGAARGGVEELAWAGVTVAAEAATLGVRLFSRALEAVRERR